MKDTNSSLRAGRSLSRIVHLQVWLSSSMSQRACFLLGAAYGAFAVDQPKGVVAIAQQLEQLGVSRYDVRHEIGSVIAEHI